MKHKRITLITIIFLSILIAVYIYSSVKQLNTNQQMEAIENAVLQSAIQCNSIEGSYPNDLEYLIENYGLTINEDKYIVVYEVIGSNMLPDVTVLEKQ